MRKVTPMLRVVAAEARGRGRRRLDEIVAEGARRMLAAALEAEVDAYLAGPAGERENAGIGWWCATGTSRHICTAIWALRAHRALQAPVVQATNQATPGLRSQ
jgi:phage gp46-like protein